MFSFGGSSSGGGGGSSFGGGGGNSFGGGGSSTQQAFGGTGGSSYGSAGGNAFGGASTGTSFGSTGGQSAFGGGGATGGGGGAFGGAFGGTGSSTGSFGGTGSSPFGGGGGSSFGSTGGGGNAFGSQNSSSSSMFGGGGGAAATNNAFGSTNAFGAGGGGTSSFSATGASPFGSTPSTPSFSSSGSANSFGSPSLFGGAKQTGGGTSFGGTSSSSFGGTQLGGATNSFGQTNQAFGQTGGGGSSSFGASNSLFGGAGQTGSSPFGGATSGGGGGGFGSTAGGMGAYSQQKGTGNPKFRTSKDPNDAKSHFHSISAMVEYRTKSFEELRAEDYELRKSGGVGGFSGGGGLTQQTASPFGSTAGGGSLGGGGGMNLFGGGATGGSSLLGGGGSTFGSTGGGTALGGGTTSSPFGGSTATSSPFGGGGGASSFGSQSTSFGGGGGGGTSLFNAGGGQTGASSPFKATSSPFGSTGTTPATPAFGAKSTSFASPTTSAFGSTSFGSSTPTTSAFGGGGAGGGGARLSTTTSPFGGTSSSSFSSMGNPGAFGGGASSFAAKSPTTTSPLNFSSLGSTPTSTWGGGTSGFGGTPGFGGQTATGGSSAFSSFSPQQQQQLQNPNATPYGYLPDLNKGKQRDPNAPQNEDAPKKTEKISLPDSLSSKFKIVPRAVPYSRTRPRQTSGQPFNSPSILGSGATPSSMGRPTMSGTYPNTPTNSFTPHAFVAKSYKTLLVSPDDDENDIDSVEEVEVLSSGTTTTIPITETQCTPLSGRSRPFETHFDDLNSPRLHDLDSSPPTSSKSEKTSDQPESLEQHQPKFRSDSSYYTIPSKESIQKMSHQQLMNLDHFVIGRSSGQGMKLGEVEWEGNVDLSFVDLNEVEITARAVEIYPDDATKPPVGDKLNREATIKLHGLWPLDKATGQKTTSEKRLRNYGAHLKKRNEQTGSKFMSWSPETGIWVFVVPHFTKYGADDDYEEDDDDEDRPEEVQLIPQQQPVILAPKKPLEVPQVVVPGSQHQADSSVSAISQQQTPPQPLQQHHGTKHFIASDSLHQELVERHQSPDEEMVQQPLFLPERLGFEARNLQSMKTSFFGEKEKTVRHRDSSVPSLHRGSETDIFSSPAPYPLLNRNQDSFLSHTSEEDQTQLVEREKSVESVPVSVMIDRPPPPSEEDDVVALEIPQPTILQQQVPFAFPLPDFIEPETVLCEESPLEEHLMRDHSYVMSRSFRAGWDPSGRLIVPNLHSGQIQILPASISPEDQEVGGSLPGLRDVWDPSSSLQNEQREFDETSSHLPLSVVGLERDLNDHQKRSLDWSFESHDRDMLVASFIDRLEIEQADEDPLSSSTEQKNQDRLICWRLVQSLWSDQVMETDETVDLNFQSESSSSEFDDDDQDDLFDRPYSDSYPLYLSRREGLSSWVRESLSDVSEPQIPENAIYTYLSGCDIVEACRVAQDTGHYRLSVLLSLALADGLQNPLDQQVDLWKEGELSEGKQRIYSLLAGRVFDSLASFWKSGFHWFNDWKRHYGMILWYSRSTIAFPGVLEFEKLVEEYGNTNLRPRYATNSRITTKYQDISFRLLKLFHSKDEFNLMLSVCSPLTHTACPLDYSLSWLLYTILVACGFKDGKWRNSLAVSFSFQLETLGLWPWAIYVLARTLGNENGLRRYAIQSLLNRHYPLLFVTVKDARLALEKSLDLPLGENRDDEAVAKRDLELLSDLPLCCKILKLQSIIRSLLLEFDAEQQYISSREVLTVALHMYEAMLNELKILLEESFEIPSEWLSESLAIYARYSGNAGAEVLHLREGGKIQESVDLLVRNVAPTILLASFVDRWNVDQIQWLLADLWKAEEETHGVAAEKDEMNESQSSQIVQQERELNSLARVYRHFAEWQLGSLTPESEDQLIQILQRSDLRQFSELERACLTQMRVVVAEARV